MYAMSGVADIAYTAAVYAMPYIAYTAAVYPITSFLQWTYAKFHHPMFAHLEVYYVDKQTHTHKQTDATENIQRCSLRYVVG